MHNRTLIAALLCLFASACAVQSLKPSDGHIRAETPRPTTIPQPVRQTAAVPAPKPTRKPDTYSVVVTNVPAREILFALARDAKLNLDIHSGIQGNVTLNAIDQTLPQILSRIAKQADMRYEIDGPNLVVMPDTPFLRIYKVDYVNLSRDATSTVAVTSQVAATGAPGGATGGGGGGGASVINTTKNRFWETLLQNIRDILRETDKEILVARRAAAGAQATQGATAQAPQAAPVPPAPPGAAGAQPAPTAPAPQPYGPTPSPQAAQEFKEYQTLEAATVIANPETGVISVRATSRQHEKVQEFLDKVMSSAKRQVFIEATIVNVELSDQYQQGINWSRLSDAAGTGVEIQQPEPGATLNSGVGPGIFVLSIANNTRLGNLAATIRLLESFGTVKTLSSPKISVLNNQTAILKVVKNLVYFEIKTDTVTPGAGAPAVTKFTTTAKSVAEGIIMSLTPQVGDDETVLLNIRPTVTKKVGDATDPNPDLVLVRNNVPIMQESEMETVMRLGSGQTAVLGGLMKDEVENKDDAVPGASRLPVIGNLFTHRNDTTRKQELVIFLRPVVIKDASIDGDFSNMRALLPDQEFFTKNLRPDGSGDPSTAGGK